MKYIFFIIIEIIFTNVIISQEFCSFGEYDFKLNKIKGLDNLDFSKIEVVDKENQKKLISYSYQDKKLNKINYNIDSESLYYDLIDSNICGRFNTISFKYVTREISERIYNNNDSIELAVKIDYNDDNKIKNIRCDYILLTYFYGENGKIKKLLKNNKIYEYNWNKDNTLKEIFVTPHKTHFSKRIKFYYDKNKISKIESIIKTLEDNTGDYKDSYCYSYKNNKVSKIKVSRLFSQGKKGGAYEYNFNYINENEFEISNKFHKYIYSKQ